MMAKICEDLSKSGSQKDLRNFLHRHYRVAALKGMNENHWAFNRFLQFLRSSFNSRGVNCRESLHV